MKAFNTLLFIGLIAIHSVTGMSYAAEPRTEEIRLAVLTNPSKETQAFLDKTGFSDCTLKKTLALTKSSWYGILGQNLYALHIDCPIAKAACPSDSIKIHSFKYSLSWSHTAALAQEKLKLLDPNTHIVNVEIEDGGYSKASKLKVAICSSN